MEDISDSYTVVHASALRRLFLKASIFSLLLAPLLATAQVKPGETQEEEANSGEVWKHWNARWISAGYLVLLEPPDVSDLWLTWDVLHDQATVDHWGHRSAPEVTGLLNEASIQKCEERLFFIWSGIISHYRWEMGWPGYTGHPRAFLVYLVLS